MNNGAGTVRFIGGQTDEVDARLVDADVRLVLGTVVDYSGVIRAKGVPAARFTAFVERGMGASPSWLVFCVDAGVAFTPSLGPVGDLRLKLDPTRATVIEGRVAWAPADIVEQDGTPFAGCPRSRLRGVAQQLAAAGISARTGTELEFVLTQPDGTPRVGPAWQGYGVRTALDVAPLLRDLAVDFDGAGVPLEQLHAEYGTDQFEISLPPADPLTTADRTVLARILVSRACARHGVGVSFAPVPFAGGAGNGAHLHLSLAAAGRGPLLSDGDGPHGLRPAGGSVIAGIVAGLPQVQGVLAGSTLSPLRLTPGNWAGAFACWGLENREAGVRLVAKSDGNPHGASVEIKPIDGSANPYLAAAVVLGLALDGIRQELPLPPEVTVDPATLPAEQHAPMRLATTQEQALDALEGSAIARALLGDLIVEGTLAVRRHEQRSYASAEPRDVAAVFRQAFSG